MADYSVSKRFALPVYKDQTSGPNEGLVIEVGDTLTLLCKSDSGVIVLKDVTVAAVNDADFPTVISWEYDSGNTYTTADRVVGVDPKHQYECPAPRNIGITGTSFTAAVTSITVNGVVTAVSPSIAVSADGATELQELLVTLLNGNGEPTVVYVDAGTDYYKFYVMNTTADVTINATALAAI